MSTPPLAYQLSGYITAEASVAVSYFRVSYFRMDERLPRTPHGQVFLNGETRMAKGDDVGEDEFLGNCAWQEDE